MSVEAWKSLCDVGAVVALFLAFAFGVGVWYTGNIINKRQGEEIKQVGIDLKDKEVKIAEAQRGVADARIELESEKQKTASFQIELGRQQERAAKAETALREISQRQQNRFVKDHSIAEALKGKPTGTVMIWYHPNDPEAYWFAFSVMAELLAANWKAPPPVPVPDNISSIAFLGPEYQAESAAIGRFDRALPPTTRITGGSAEITLLSNAPDKGDPESLVAILTSALKPLVFGGFGWRLATTLPDNTFILIVGPKP